MRDSYYDEMLELSIFTVLFDGITAVTVNLQSEVPHALNIVFHGAFLLGLETIIFFLFRYLRWITKNPKLDKGQKFIVYIPWVVSIIIGILNLGNIEFRQGEITNYSMGVAVYTCFITAFIYIVASIGVFLRSWKFIDISKRIMILTYLLVITGVCIIQSIYRESLVTSVAVTIMTLGAYITQENPAFDDLKKDHDMMVIGFADLVENRDENTGGHIKRTSEYAKVIVEELRKEGIYSNILTEDYMEYVIKAAPLHDIGKISTPDSILTKPGKLTDEEYSVMKQHAPKGGEILRNLLSGINNQTYEDIAYQVARHHHEKWNGKGYPDGLIGEGIPLCARIMAVADVFDAISQKRCYRDAMPLDKCFDIIEEGRGIDFDPYIVDAFFFIRKDVENICLSYRDEEA